MAMKVVFVVALVLPALTNAGASAGTQQHHRSKVTPVQKVIQMMESMMAKGKEEKQKEQVQFAAYKQFCDDTSSEKKKAIAKAEEAIEVLKADIAKYIADAETLKKEIAEHDEDISVWEGDMKAATNVRKEEKADFTKEQADYSESIDALSRAVDVLKKQDKTTAQASFLQLKALKTAKFMPDSAKRLMASFLDDGEDQDPLDVSAPEAAGYEFQSGGVIEMLEGLEDKFIKERTELEKEEMNAQHAYDMLMDDLTTMTEQAKEDSTTKSEIRSKKIKKKAQAEADLDETTDSKAADEKYLADLTATCDQKSSDFEARQELRTEELEAIQKAIDIISSNSVSGNAGKHLPSFVQTRTAVSFAQLRATSQNIARQRLIGYLKGKASMIKSQVLLQVALRVEDDPFGKIKKMIKELIVRLMEEATEEAEHKGWCDKELATNEKTRTEKSDAVMTLSAEIEELTASIAKLGKDLANLAKAVADLETAMAKATELRKEEREKNTQTIQDAEEAGAAVAQALTVLKEFYAKASEATAFLQTNGKQEPPEIFDSPYKGMGGEGGVVGMLEVIQSDFARLEAETKAAEEASEKEYNQFMEDSKIDKAAKSQEIEDKTIMKKEQEDTLLTTKEDLEGNQKELDAALLYFDKLKPSCVDADVSYEDRVKRRKEEIASLQDALKILNGE